MGICTGIYCIVFFIYTYHILNEKSNLQKIIYTNCLIWAVKSLKKLRTAYFKTEGYCLLRVRKGTEGQNNYQVIFVFNVN